MYREHWEHSRHCEKEMFWFTNIYVAVVAAILAFMRYSCDGGLTDIVQTLVLLMFGLILSVLGFFIMISLSLGHQNYIMNIVTICYYWNLSEFYANPRKPVYYKTLHRWFFEITIALFVVLFLFYGYWGLTSSTPSTRSVVALIGAFIIIAYAIDKWYQKTWRKYSKERQDYIWALRNDTEGIYRKEWKPLFKKPEFWKEITEKAKEGESSHKEKVSDS